jgi:hypothetical protein
LWQEQQAIADMVTHQSPSKTNFGISVTLRMCRLIAGQIKSDFPNCGKPSAIIATRGLFGGFRTVAKKPAKSLKSHPFAA